MRALITITSLIVLSIGMAGCSFGPVKTPAVAQYFLQPLPQDGTSSEKPILHKGSVLVMPIKSVPGYDSNSMHYVMTPYQLQAFVTHQWVSSPATMWQPILVSSLRHAGIAVVVATPTPVETAYSVQVHLYQFEQNFQRPQSVFDVTVSVQIQNNKTGRVIGVREFSAQVPAQTNTPYAGVLAANKAVAQLDKAIGYYVVESIH